MVVEFRRRRRSLARKTPRIETSACRRSDSCDVPPVLRLDVAGRGICAARPNFSTELRSLAKLGLSSYAGRLPPSHQTDELQGITVLHGGGSRFVILPILLVLYDIPSPFRDLKFSHPANPADN